MEVLAAGCVLAAAEVALGWPARVLALALAVVAAGSLATNANRLRLIVRDLAARRPV